LAIVLGSVLDGIPESFVLGLTVLQGRVSLSLLAGVALSNLRAARTSSQLNQSMRRAGARAKHAGVPLRRIRAVEGAGRLFSTPSRPALRAAACGGRPRAGSDATATGEPASPSSAAGTDTAP
jgi:hypothetical protein